MSRPKIWATCAAGCRWEAVHKQDFIDAATYVKLNYEDTCYLELGNQYKIFSPNVENVGYGCSITFKYKSGESETLYNFTIPHEDKYANYVVFRLLEASINESGLTLVYEIAGVRYTETIEGTDLSLIEENYLYVENADKVYLFNDEASIVMETKVLCSTQKTLLANAWSNSISIGDGTPDNSLYQKVTMAYDGRKRNEIDVLPESIEEWARCGVYAFGESESGILFKCKEQPTTDLKFRVVSMEVEYVSE